MLVMVNKITKFTDMKINTVNGKYMMYNIFNICFNLFASAYFINSFLGTSMV